MKLFKSLAIFTMALGFCFAAGACGGDTDSTSSTPSNSSTQSSVEQTTDAYVFTVLNADGSAAQGVNVQLCVLGNSAACFMPVATDANGKVSYNPMGFPGAGEYEIHLFDLSMQPLEFDGPVSTPTVYGEITLTLK